MTFRIVATLAMGLALAGCGGNPFVEGDGNEGGNGDGNGGTTDPIPAALRGNVESVTRQTTPEGTVLIATIDVGLASGTRATRFVRAEEYDINGFDAYTFQQNPNTRLFIAMNDDTKDGSGTATVIASGQFTQMVWGSDFDARGFSRPPEGDAAQAHYAGRYVGFVNSGTAVSGPGAPNDPIRPRQVTGDTAMTANFTSGRVEGSISNRASSLQDGTPPVEFADLFLQITEIAPDGTFRGDVVFREDAPAGTIGGAFSGNGATGVVGAIELRPVEGNTQVLERGVFVADRCVVGDLPPCPQPLPTAP